MKTKTVYRLEYDFKDAESLKKCLIMLDGLGLYFHRVYKIEQIEVE